MPVLVLANEATAARRRVYFHLVDATDGITPETGEASGQPQVSTNGAAWTNTGIGTLTHVGNGRYYADLTQALVATAGDSIETRYKSANTAESPGDSVRVVAFDPYDTVRLGLTALPNAAADAAGGLPISDAGGLDLDAKVGALTFTVANQLDANAVAISGDATAADNLEADYDGTGLTRANSTIGTVTTLTGHTAQSGDSFGRLGVAGAGLTDLGGMSTAMKAQVEAEVGDALDTAIAEPTGPFAWASASVRNVLGWLGARARNKATQTSTTMTLRNDADNADIATAPVSDDGTTFTRGEWSSP